jgi:hypothetical protein
MKESGYYISPEKFTLTIKYDLSASRKPGAQNWVLSTGKRFPTLEGAMDFGEKTSLEWLKRRTEAVATTRAVEVRVRTFSGGVR